MAQEEYLKKITALLDQIIARYQPGGEFEQKALETYETGKGKSLASQQQSLVSAGLSGTTIGAGLESRYEQEVGVPFKLGVAEQRTRGITQAMQAKAGFLERGYQFEEQRKLDEARAHAAVVSAQSGRGGSGQVGVSSGASLSAGPSEAALRERARYTQDPGYGEDAGGYINPGAAYSGDTQWYDKHGQPVAAGSPYAVKQGRNQPVSGDYAAFGGGGGAGMPSYTGAGQTEKQAMADLYLQSGGAYGGVNKLG